MVHGRTLGVKCLRDQDGPMAADGVRMEIAEIFAPLTTETRTVHVPRKKTIKNRIYLLFSIRL
jgi:hypothetical protein